MNGIYGYQWTRQYGDEPDATGVWKIALSGLTQRQIWGGIESLIFSGGEWPPTAAKFRELCLGGSDLPSFDSAWFELSNYLSSAPHRRNIKNLHPAVRYTYRTIDPWTFQQLNGDKQHQLFKSAYAATLASVKNGLAFDEPEPAKALPFDPPGPPASRETAERGISALKSMFEE